MKRLCYENYLYLIPFWGPEVNILKEEAEPYYRSLRDVGVLHDTPEQAADAVAEAYGNVEKWWNDSEHSRVVNDFCQWSARTTPDDSKRWRAFFNMISRDHVPRNFTELKNVFTTGFQK